MKKLRVRSRDWVIEAEPNRVTQVKSLDNDGYVAIQVTTGERRRNPGN